MAVAIEVAPYFAKLADKWVGYRFYDGLQKFVVDKTDIELD